MWQEKTLNILNALPKEDIKEVFLWAIEQIENNPKFQSAKKYWDELDEEHKNQYYEDGWWSWKYLTTWPLTPRVTKKWMKIDVKDNLYITASPLMRLWVSFWLLDKPRDLSNEDLIGNISKDAHNYNRFIKLLSITCKTQPELWELIPFVTALEPYVQWYEENWASLMQEKIRNKQLETTEKSTTHNLSVSEEDILEAKVVKNKTD